MLFILIFTVVFSEILIEEDFTTWLPTGWYTEGGTNWNQGSGSNAGGTPPEAEFYWSPQTVATQRLCSLPVNTVGATSLDLEFKHTNNDFNGDYEIRLETSSDGVNWNTASIFPSSSFTAVLEQLILTTPDVGSSSFRLAWTFDGDSWNINYWYVDDVILSGDLITYDNDLAALSITGPGNVNQGNSEIYDIVVKNAGNIDQDNYTVRLMREGNIEITSQEISDNLASGEQVTHHLVWNIPSDEPEGSTYLFGEVVLDNDENPVNNITGNLSVQIFQAGTLQITVGDGTDLDERIPMCFSYHNSLTETMYYPSELNSGGMIIGISYENNFVSILHGKPTKVWLGETTLTDFSGGWIPSYQLTNVFDSNVNYPSGHNTIMIDFDTPYFYEGGILVVMVQRPWDDNIYSPSDRFYITMTSDFPDRTIYNRDNDEEYSPSNPPAQFFLYDQFPNTTFYFTFGGLGNVEGYVFDEDENPLQGALIEILGSGNFTYSNQEGYFQFSNIPVGMQTFTATIFGYNPQIIEAEIIEDQTIQIQFNLVPLGTVSINGHVVGSDFPETGLEGAIVSLAGLEDYETETGPDGNFLFPEVYANENYNMNISHENYESYTEDIFVNEADLDLGTLILNELTLPPGNVFAVQNQEETEVELSWNMPGAGLSEFRYDDGNAVFQVGFSNTPSNAVFGSSHFHNAVVQEVHWFLTSTWGSHTQVKIFIFGLDNDGLPDSDQLLHQSGLMPNNDDEWNTYILPESVNAPEGFFIGVNTPGIYTGIGLDDGIDEPWEFIPGTQMANENWSSGEWQDIGDIDPQFQKNMLIRAYGIDFGEIGRTGENEFSILPSSKFDNYNRINEQFKENHNLNREFESFNIYRFFEFDHDNPENWDLIAAALTDTFYTDMNWAPLPIGIYQFAVTSVHTNNVESVPAFSNTVYKSTVSTDEHDLEQQITELKHNHPNPFNTSTTIYFSVTQNSEFVNIEIFNIKGQKVRTLECINSFDVKATESLYHIEWNGKDESGKHVNSGIYFYKLKSDGFESSVRKMVLLR